MSVSKHNLSIHAAVMSCVVRCAESDTPLVLLNDFLENLARIGWRPDDVKAVQRAALPMLLEIKTGDTVDTGDATMTANYPIDAA
jgi:hypothetical protein